MITALLLSSILLPGQTCPSYTTCAFQPVVGTQPSYAAINAMMEDLADNNLGDRAPSLPEMEAGPSRVRGAPRFPCTLFKAIGIIESNWRQFCADTGKTVISFDCGFGISQITSGAANYGPRITTEAAYNIGSGAVILVGKWNADQTYGGQINQGTPTILEDWYYATWAYNSFSIRNNPNNAMFPANRPPYAGPGGLSRGSYPYQELVWGRIQYPLSVGGTRLYEPATVSYPNLADIPPPPSSGSHLFQADLTITPTHDNPCADPCANNSCPPVTEVIVDNLDSGFDVVGPSMAAESGGYRDSLLYVPAQPAGSPQSVATFIPALPSDGIWEIAGHIPLNPADSANIPVEILAQGGVVEKRMDQSVTGGVWQVLGRAKLRAGHTRVRVRDDSGEMDATVGFDAIRWTWVGFGGMTSQGGSCMDSTECRDSLTCINGTCAPPCFEVPCAAGLVCNQTSGLCAPAPPDAGMPVESSSSSSEMGNSSSAVASSASSGSSSSGVQVSSGEGSSSSEAADSGEPGGAQPAAGCPVGCDVSGGGMPLWLLLALGLRRRR